MGKVLRVVSTRSAVYGNSAFAGHLRSVFYSNSPVFEWLTPGKAFHSCLGGCLSINVLLIDSHSIHFHA